MEQVHAPVKSKSSGKADDAAADNDDAMGFPLHVSFLVYSPSPSPSIKDFLWPAKQWSHVHQSPWAIYMHPGRWPPRWIIKQWSHVHGWNSLWSAKRQSNEKSLARCAVVLVQMNISFDFWARIPRYFTEVPYRYRDTYPILRYAAHTLSRILWGLYCQDLHSDAYSKRSCFLNCCAQFSWCVGLVTGVVGAILLKIPV